MALLSPGAPFSGDAPSSTPVSSTQLVLTRETAPGLSGRRSGAVPKPPFAWASQITSERPDDPPAPLPLAALVFRLLSTRLRLPEDLIAAALTSLRPKARAPEGPSFRETIAIEDILEDLGDDEDISRLLRLEPASDSAEVAGQPPRPPESAAKVASHSLVQLVDDDTTLRETERACSPPCGPG